MKVFLYLGFLPFALSTFPGLSSLKVWLAGRQQSIVNLIDNPTKRSTVPQFLLDAQHPWVTENRRRLEGLQDGESFLCSISHLESAEAPSASGQLAIPLDLFDNLEIDNNRYGVSRPGWPNALERLGEMQRCPRALKEVKKLKVDVYLHHGTVINEIASMLELPEPPENLLTLFGDVLESMTNLQELDWNIPKEDTHYFEQAFKARSLTLPSVKLLHPGPSSHYLVAMCPNVEDLSNGGSFQWYHGYMPDNRDWGLQFIQAAASTPKVKRFAMVGGHGGWTPLYVTEVAKAMPQLESLGLYGRLGTDMGYTGINTGDSGKLSAILELLHGLENLTHLDLPDSSGLGVGFNGGPGCGNVYDGPGGLSYLAQVTREAAEATEEASQIVVAGLPQLESFTIGDDAPNITRDHGILLNATWPWTGRMEDWLLENFPGYLEDSWDGNRVQYGSMDDDAM